MLGGLNAQFYHVDSDYYQWTLDQRMECLGAPSIHHLCKTLLFTNTRWTATDDPNFSQYYLVCVQYTDKIDSQKLNEFVRSTCLPRSKKSFNLRVPDAQTAFNVTGYETGGVTPFALASPIPVIITQKMAQLNVVFLGAGHVDWKLSISMQEFKNVTKCTVADLSL